MTGEPKTDGLSQSHEIALSEPSLYSFEKGDELCRLFEIVFGKTMGRTESIDHYYWEYHNSPAGKAIVHIITNGECRIVCAYPTLPLRIKFMSATARASLSFDSMTHPEYKGRGLFTTLGKTVYQYLEQNDYLLTYGFPNKNIQKLRVNQLQWFEVSDFPLLIKVMDFEPLVSRYFPYRIPARITGAILNSLAGVFFRKSRMKNNELTIEEVSSFDSEFDKFWHRVRNCFPICVERDADYLRWRYGKPEEKYAILKLKIKGKMTGYAVLKSDDRFGLKTGYIMDFIVSPEDDYIRKLISEVLSEFERRKDDVVSVLLMKNNPYYALFRRFGFISVPGRLHPQEIHFGCRVNVRNEHEDKIRDPGNWFIGWGDTDLL